jgi:hypothetical protein
MHSGTVCSQPLDPRTRAFYCLALATLSEAQVPFLVGGAYALERYTGIPPHTKDFDIFVRQADCQHAFEALSATGCRTEATFPHWLGKAFCGDDFIDIIFSSGNGIAGVDDAWFEHAVQGEVLGTPVKLCPAEEMIWQKAFIMERERYDGADVAHLLRACGQSLDWPRLLGRFGPHWRVLLSHLVLFGFVYPAERTQIPDWAMQELLQRLRAELVTGPAAERLCQGTILSRAQYLFDVEQWAYQDARLPPSGNMTEEQTAHWTAAIEDGE